MARDGANRVAGQDRHFVHDEHGLAEQHLGMKRTRAVSGQEIAQVEREVRIGNAVAVGRARREGEVFPALIFGRLEKEKVNSIG